MTTLQTSFSYNQPPQAGSSSNGEQAHTGIAEDFLAAVGRRRFGTILVDPPWQFQNRTGKIAPEHKRLSRYGTLGLEEIKMLPVAKAAAVTSRYAGRNFPG
jgi:hypothetical protein